MAGGMAGWRPRVLLRQINFRALYEMNVGSSELASIRNGTAPQGRLIVAQDAVLRSVRQRIKSRRDG